MRPLRYLRSAVPVLFATAATIAVIPAATASADVTGTVITSPANNAVVDTPNIIDFLPETTTPLTGTATVDGPEGNFVDIYMVSGFIYAGPGGSVIQVGGPIEVAADGSFSAEFPTPPLNSRLVAMPASEGEGAQAAAAAAVGDPNSPFKSTLVLGGGFQASLYEAPLDKLRSIAVRGQQRGFFMVGPTSFPEYGLEDFGGLFGGPFGANGIEPGMTFLGTGSLWSHYNYSRGPVMVDGVRGYLRDQIPVPSEDPLTDPTVTRTVDTTTGGQTVVQTQSIYVAANQDEDPDAVPLEDGYRPSGLELVRTVVQDHDGAQATVKDVYRSTDGKAHQIDLLYAEGLGLPFDGGIYGGGCGPFCPEAVSSGAPGSPRSIVNALEQTTNEPEPEFTLEPPTFRIPWESGNTWGTRAQADPLSAPPGERSTVFTRIPFSFLALLTSGGDEPAFVPSYGAITFGTRPSGGVFLVDPMLFGALWQGRSSQFVAHFVRDIPAGGSTPITQVYSQGLTENAVKDLAAEAERALTPATPPGPPAETPKPPPVPLPTRRVTPRSLSASATPKQDLTGPRRFRFTGKLTLPAGASAAGCRAGGTVSVQVHAGRNTISTRRVRLDSKCRYTVRVTFKSVKRFGKHKRLKVTTRWTGNSAIAGRKAKTISVRVR